MPFVVKDDEPANPADVCLLGAPAVMADTNGLTNLIEKSWRLRIWREHCRPVVRF